MEKQILSVTVVNRRSLLERRRRVANSPRGLNVVLLSGACRGQKKASRI